MHSLPRLASILSLAVGFGFVVGRGFAAEGKKYIGEVVVHGSATLPVHITASSPDLQHLAERAFASHGCYEVVGARQMYDFKFTAVGPAQVRVDITKGAGVAVASQTVNGTSLRNALLRAADVAVEKTNGVGLRGFFTARLTFVTTRSGKSEICVSDLFMGEAKQLTNDRALALTPRWAPDGSRIIFTSYFKTGAPDIFLIDPQTGRRDTYLSLRGTNMGARFSPNGQQVAMVLTGEGASEIYTRGAQGGQVVRRTRMDAAKASPCWSPDGSQIVFTMEPGPQLYLMSAGGGAPRRLSSQFSYMAEPDWSRTERNKIACTVRAGGYQIAVVDAATGAAEVVSKAAFDGIEPSWLADGRHLVYTARDRRSTVLCILDTKTGRSTRISGDMTELQANVWTP